MTRGRTVSERWMLRHSIGKQTRKTYKSQLRKHKSLGYKPNFKGLKQRILCLDGTDPRTLNNLRFAIQWHRRTHGKDELTPEQKATVRTLLRGRRGAMGHRKPKGVINYKRLQEMIKWMNEQGAPVRMLTSIAVVWATGLRTAQVANLRRSNFRLVDDQWVVDIEECHKPDQGNRSVRRQLMLPTEPRLKDVLDEHLATLGQNSKVCPGWKAAEVNRWIQRTAKSLKWTRKANWSGAHQLRHGVAYETATRMTNEEASRLLGHTLRPVRGATQRYTEPEGQRIARHRRQQRLLSERRSERRSNRRSKRAKKESRKRRR